LRLLGGLSLNYFCWLLKRPQRRSAKISLSGAAGLISTMEDIANCHRTASPINMLDFRSSITVTAVNLADHLRH
jgi:hypothetical protein